jgi:hypothetical protein
VEVVGCMSRAQILKHFEMTAGLKVQAQGFQISLLIFNLSGKLLFFYLIYLKLFFLTTQKNVPV